MPKSKILTIAGAAKSLRNAKFLSSPSARLFNCAGLTAAIGLASLPAFLTLSPIFIVSSAHAEDVGSTTHSLDTTATVDPTISLTAGSVDIRIRPSALGVFKTGTVTASVSTNSTDGYTLYLSSNSNSLKHQDRNDVISSITDTFTGENMPFNTWGYRLGASTGETEEERDAADRAESYSPVPRSYVIIKETDSPAPSGGDANTVTFGVKVDTSIPSGTYSGKVMFTAISNNIDSGATTLPAWFSPTTNKLITKMQEMTHEICANIPTPSYTATEETMDINLYKTDDDTRINQVPARILKDVRDNNEYKVRKLADGNCWMVESLAIAGTDKTHSRVLTPADSNVTADFELPAAVIVDFVINDKTKAYVSNGGVNDTYLYNFYAATAGSGGSISSGNASQDICPKGWHLPNSNGNASLDKLLRVGQGGYEIATNSNDYSTDKVSWGTYAGLSTATANPVGLQLTGYFGSGSLYYTGNGLYWTRTANSADNAYNLIYGRNIVSSQNIGSKGNGFGVRCVSE